MTSPHDAPRSAPLNVCLVGAMFGAAGRVPSPSERLGRRLAAEGYGVRLVSRHRSRIVRLLDILAALARWRRWADVAVVDVFSGSALRLNDVVTAALVALRIPAVLVLHGGNLPAYAARHPARVDRVLRRGAVVSPSGYLASRFRRPDRDVEVIPNLLDVERYPHRRRVDAEPRLLWMRTLTPTYHPEMAIEVIGHLASSHPGASLTMAGQDRGSGESVRATVERLGVAARVELAGFLDDAGKRRAFDRHDVFINTNRIDNMPVSVLEACASGLCVVATEVGGIPYLLEHGENALLVPDGDAAAMAAAVRRILTEPDLAARLSDGARRLALGCTWEAVGPRWRRVLATAARRAG